MIEVGAIVVLVVFFYCILLGFKEEKARISEYGDSYLYQNNDDLEADLYAAYTYQETGEPSAFLLFDYEEPEPMVAQLPAQKPKPKRKSRSDGQAKRIRDLESQVKKLEKLVSGQQKYPVKNTPKINPLQQDCVDALVALGYNKTESKNIVKSNLTDDITTVQDFLVIAMRKG